MVALSNGAEEHSVPKVSFIKSAGEKEREGMQADTGLLEEEGILWYFQIGELTAIGIRCTSSQRKVLDISCEIKVHGKGKGKARATRRYYKGEDEKRVLDDGLVPFRKKTGGVAPVIV